MALCVLRYVCVGGSSLPSPTDGTHGYKCPPGFSCPPGAHHELPCKPGTFSPLPGADTCLSCPQGTYCPQAATVEPIICPKGNPRTNLAFLLPSRSTGCSGTQLCHLDYVQSFHTQRSNETSASLSRATHTMGLVVLQREDVG